MLKCGDHHFWSSVAGHISVPAGPLQLFAAIYGSASHSLTSVIIPSHFSMPVNVS